MAETEQVLHRDDPLSCIPGMDRRPFSGCGTEYDLWAETYPDAAFALMIRQGEYQSYFLRLDREQAGIFHRAYMALLRGESIADVRFRYERDTTQYLQRHMWD